MPVRHLQLAPCAACHRAAQWSAHFLAAPPASRRTLAVPAVLAFDKNRSGTIDVWELRQVLEGASARTTQAAATHRCLRFPTPQPARASTITPRDAAVWCPAHASPAAMGQKPTEEELFQMISEVDENMSGSIDFGEFLKVSHAETGRHAERGRGLVSSSSSSSVVTMLRAAGGCGMR